jgi:multidrug resistance efflux pump
MAATQLDTLKPIKPRRRQYRVLMSATPVVVWLLAIGAAVWVHQSTQRGGLFVGYAEDRSVTLAHLEAGTVRQVRVQLHQDVGRGQILMAMDDRAERLGLAAIEKDLERLRATVASEAALLAADNARAAGDYEDLTRRFLVDREAAHIQYLAQVLEDANDRVLLRGAWIEYDIVRDLYNRDHGTFRELNDAETEVDSIEARVEQNELVLARMKKAFEDADRRWFQFTQREDLTVPYDSTLTPVRLAADVREKELEELVLRIDSHVLRSPVEGQISALYAAAGDRVLAGDPLLAISPTETQRVVVYLPEKQALAMRVGDSVSVHPVASTTGRPPGHPAKVVSLSAVVAEAPLRYRKVPTWPVWGRAMVVSVEDDARLMPGEAVRVSLAR